MDLTAVFSATLKSLREWRGLSQDQIANGSRLDRTYISQLERGLKSPTLTTIEKLAGVLSIDPVRLLRSVSDLAPPLTVADYHLRASTDIVVRCPDREAKVATQTIIRALDRAHGMIDELYASRLDIAALLGMRNLSAFVGELFATSIEAEAGGQLLRNPHQDGYPDLLLMDEMGGKLWTALSNRMTEKAPFSPFAGGGLEVKATCGSVPSPAQSRKGGQSRPVMGMTRIGVAKSYDWKAHHRDTNNLLGVYWDFIGKRPRIAAVFFCSRLTSADWGKIVRPRTGGGRTTSVSIMGLPGIKKMYDGWLCVLARGGYAEFFNQRNGGHAIPASLGPKSGPSAENSVDDDTPR